MNPAQGLGVTNWIGLLYINVLNEGTQYKKDIPDCLSVKPTLDEWRGGGFFLAGLYIKR